jgi:hypothetical protein
MALIELRTTPSERELRWFGWILAAAWGLAGVLCFPRWPVVAYILWGVAVANLAIYYGVPAVRRPLFLAWMYVAYPLGWVLSHLVMMVVYYGCLTPIGILLRLLRYDPLQRRRPQRASHWHPRSAPPPPARYFRQF